MRGRIPAVIICLALLLGACEKEEVIVDTNLPPETRITGAPAESSEAYYQVHLYWRGVDTDGYVDRFIYAVDDTTPGWLTTSKTDSLFRFPVDVQGETRKEHRFFLCAIDNEGKRDPTPSHIYFLASNLELPTPIFVFPSPDHPDTFDYASSVSVRWTGIDDGFIGRYMYWMDQDEPVWVEATQETMEVTYEVLTSGLRTFSVVAEDDALGLTEPPTALRFVMNHDPQTEFIEISCYYPRLDTIRTVVQGDTVWRGSTLTFTYFGRDYDSLPTPGMLCTKFRWHSNWGYSSPGKLGVALGDTSRTDTLAIDERLSGPYWLRVMGQDVNDTSRVDLTFNELNQLDFYVNLVPVCSFDSVAVGDTVYVDVDPGDTISISSTDSVTVHFFVEDPDPREKPILFAEWGLDEPPKKVVILDEGRGVVTVPAEDLSPGESHVFRLLGRDDVLKSTPIRLWIDVASKGRTSTRR